MSIKVAQNFDYKGQLPNFERDSFTTLIELRDSNPDWFDDGHISYCKETESHYVFNKENTFNEETGYFRIFKGDASESVGGGSIYQGDTAPENTDLLWLDTGTEYTDSEDVATIESLQEAVRLLSTEVNSIKLLRTNGVVAGTVSDSVRVYLANSSDPVKPETSLDDELEEDSSSSTIVPDYSDLEEVEPEYEDCEEPNVPHISIKMGTYSQLQAYIKNFIPGELLWCTNKRKLYIYINGSLVVVAGGSATDDDDDDNTGGSTDMDTDEILKLINNQLQQVESIGFIPVGSTEPKYTVKVSKEGTLLCYDKTLDNWQPIPGENYYFHDSVSHSGLLINSFYLGGDGDEHSYQPCSHNYVELSNVWMKSKTAEQKDINLNGFYLLYLNINDKSWKALPLWGTIKANSTFVIRGAQCSVMDANTTVIKVKNYDMVWETSVGTDTVTGNTIYEPIKFSQDDAVFYLAWSDPAKPGQFYTMDSADNSVLLSEFPIGENKLIDVEKGGCAKGYIDLESFNNSTICEKKTYMLPDGVSAKDMLFRRWYPMDPVGQSNPDDGLTAHNNLKYLTATYLNGSNWDNKIPLEEWTPKASWEGKSMRETRSLFLEDKPNTLTITFGRQGSDDSPESNGDGYKNNKGIGAYRGFCWNSVGYYDEYLWIRKVGDTEWEKVESFRDDMVYFDSRTSNGIQLLTNVKKDGKKYKDASIYTLFTWPDTITSDSNYESKYLGYFTRNRWESSYGQVMTNHKVVLAGLKEGAYEYKVVRGIDENSTYQSKVRNFYVHKDLDLKNFSFVHTTDQQAVTWEEWETWVLTARMMKKQYMKDVELPTAAVCNIDEAGNDTELRKSLTVGADGTPIYVYFKGDEVNAEGYVYESLDSSASITGEFILGATTKILTLKGVTTNIENATRTTYTIGTIPNDYKFVINTGDVCYNGSRSNEWLDYFYAQEPLDDREEMLTVGNNDLIPPSMRDIGTGQESPWKINPAVIDYFYAVDFRPENPPIFVGTSSENENSTVVFKMPGLYSFNYGDFHFISLLSEIRTISNKADDVAVGSQKKLAQSTVNTVWGVKDELRQSYNNNPTNNKNNQASKIFDTLEGWMTKDLMLWKGKTETEIIAEYNTSQSNPNNMNYKWEDARYDDSIVNNCSKCIIYTHEMPFNITSSGSYNNYSSGNSVPRETAKAYLNRLHNFEFQRLFKLWGIHMVMGGHKHTVAITTPVYDAPIGYNPITKKMHDEYNNGTYKDDKENPVNIGYYLNEDYDQILNDTRIDSVVGKDDSGNLKTYYVKNDNGSFSHPSSFRPFVQITPEEWSKDRLKYEQWTNEIYNNSSLPIKYTSSGVNIKNEYLKDNDIYVKIDKKYVLLTESNGVDKDGKARQQFVKSILITQHWGKLKDEDGKETDEEGWIDTTTTTYVVIELGAYVKINEDYKLYDADAHVGMDRYIIKTTKTPSQVGELELASKSYVNTLIASNSLTKAGAYPRCRVEIVDSINAPSYIMAQTAGFKNKSNSDLACKSTDGIIPWERFYVAGDSISKQCAPHYGVYKVITEPEEGDPLGPRIEVYMYRVSGMYEDTSTSSDGGSPAGYWSLAKIYLHGETLEENRNYFAGENGVLKIELFNTGGTTIKL